MKLTKETVCVYIENEAHLQEARELLEKYNQPIFEMFFNLDSGKHLICDDEDFDWFVTASKKNLEGKTTITLSELEQILKS